jgi:hypothetical protein
MSNSIGECFDDVLEVGQRWCESESKPRSGDSRTAVN